MADKRFFRSEGPFSLAAIAAEVGAALQQTERGNMLVYDVAELCQAGERDLSVFSDVAHTAAFAGSRAAAIVTSARLSALPHGDCAILLCDDPRLVFAHIGRMFYPRVTTSKHHHNGAHVAADAVLGADVELAPGAVVEAGARIGARSRIGANAVIGAGVELGEDCTIGANCSISHALIGHHVTIAANTAIGGEGFGFAPTRTGMTKISQLGRVLIGNHVDIGNNVAVDRGSLGDTVIGDGTALDNLVHIAHNVRLGKGCVLAAQVGIAGSTTLGDYVMMGGHAAIKDHVVIGNHVRIAAKSGVIHNIPDGSVIGGLPAIPTREWHRQTATLARLARRKPSDGKN
ncbi:MAG: UDP-3-O-(3-hydroxymyristoyl)glucosamine N-acyltransferase [Alphaproteobacteria bacterium]|nr:UDP-3-O-(3-hydroxymyristoyl)glucosamine N-acyltransferase [Alphaproteobacteria bacterium]